mgnify:FL=1
MSDPHSYNVITAQKLVRLFLRTHSDSRYAKFEQAAMEGHGPALFNAINEIGMLAPIVEWATKGTQWERSGQEAHTTAQQVIALATNTGLFERDADGGVVYPNFRPVGEYGRFLEVAKPKSVLDDGDDGPDLAWFSAPPPAATLDNRPATGDNRPDEGGGSVPILTSGASPRQPPPAFSIEGVDIATMNPFDNPSAYTIPDISGIPGYVPFPNEASK